MPETSLFTKKTLLNPYPVFKRIREENSLYFDSQKQCWVTTGFEVTSFLMRHPDISTRTIQTLLNPEEQQADPEVFARLKSMPSSMVGMDPPDHTRMRRIANPLFSREAVSRWETMIQRVFDSILEPLLTNAAETRSFDLVNDIARRYPFEIICELFDFPETERTAYLQRLEVVMAFFGHAMEGDRNAMAREAVNNSTINREMFTRFIRERAKNPGDDMISVLADALNQGIATEEEIAATCSLLVTAGHITTIDMLSNGICQLLKNREQWNLLVSNPELASSTVEEMLRFDASVIFVFRKALRDIDYNGTTIAAGDYIALGLAAANHDPAVNPDPEIFDITRQSPKHIAFGHGIHTCLGARLARLDLTIALKTLARKMPGLKLAEDPTPYIKAETLIQKGFHKLPLTF
ncbi:cytochrome P450 [Endozoicomonadaceae bacterium StTr2]